eukprot:CAMPEP_0174745276 /NCGR_PEP_ID=MMETSP1094-20130205/86414_1 /TAXON_ID=156173 /ORGANISM="Chrysochromulina brevifilum, Strain UTEX LB 985" /LENGTH=151 /DNA_ID=CAMNT_0015949807 /DNA_START=130 /DNA_END=585 /DNA_ORIENTATION=-
MQVRGRRVCPHPCPISEQPAEPKSENSLCLLGELQSFGVPVQPVVEAIGRVMPPTYHVTALTQLVHPCCSRPVHLKPRHHAPCQVEVTHPPYNETQLTLHCRALSPFVLAHEEIAKVIGQLPGCNVGILDETAPAFTDPIQDIAPVLAELV